MAPKWDSFHLGGVSRYLRTDSSLEDVPFPGNHSHHCNHPTLPSRAPFPPPKLLSWEVTCLFLFLHSTAETKPELKKKKNRAEFLRNTLLKSPKISITVSEMEEYHPAHTVNITVDWIFWKTHCKHIESLDNMQPALFYVHGWSLKKVREISNICQ